MARVIINWLMPILADNRTHTPSIHMQPDLSLHISPTRWLRFGVMVGYRFATAVEDFDYDASAVSGVLAGGNIQGGWF